MEREGRVGESQVNQDLLAKVKATEDKMADMERKMEFMNTSNVDEYQYLRFANANSGNEQQINFARQVRKILVNEVKVELGRLFPVGVPTSLRQIIEKGEETLKFRMKVIAFAESSPYGWKAANEFATLLKSSDDSDYKKKDEAEKRAGRKVEADKKEKYKNKYAGAGGDRSRRSRSRSERRTARKSRSRSKPKYGGGQSFALGDLVDGQSFAREDDVYVSRASPVESCFKVLCTGTPELATSVASMATYLPPAPGPRNKGTFKKRCFINYGYNKSYACKSSVLERVFDSAAKVQVEVSEASGSVLALSSEVPKASSLVGGQLVVGAVASGLVSRSLVGSVPVPGSDFRDVEESEVLTHCQGCLRFHPELLAWFHRRVQEI